MKDTKRRSLPAAAALAAACALAAPAAAGAQPLAGPEEVEIARDAASLREHVRPHPDPDRADTALVFTNTGPTPARVRCVARDAQGQPLGRAWLRLPAHGLRYALASDLSRGTDFVGSAECHSDGRVVGSALFAGPDLTDLPARSRAGAAGSAIRFPVVASY